MSDLHNRPASNPGGCECRGCGVIFVGEEYHFWCAVCADAPKCPYCGTTQDLRQVHDGGGFTDPDYICEGCFTPRDDGPCFDDLPLAPAIDPAKKQPQRAEKLNVHDSVWKWMEAGYRLHRNGRVNNIVTALERLASAEAEYRRAYEKHGDGAIETGRTWDDLRRSGDLARLALNRLQFADPQSHIENRT